MIRFIDLTEQIGEPRFAFWSDQRRELVNYEGYTDWETWEAFEDDVRSHYYHPSLREKADPLLQKFRAVFPKVWPFSDIGNKPEIVWWDYGVSIEGVYISNHGEPKVLAETLAKKLGVVARERLVGPTHT